MREQSQLGRLTAQVTQSVVTVGVFTLNLAGACIHVHCYVIRTRLVARLASICGL